MGRVHLVVLAVATLLAGGALAVAQAPADTDLSGVYRCDGVNGDGSPYRGVVVIARHRDAYQVQWTFGGRTRAVGLGIRTGNTLAVSYVSSSSGVVLYEIKEGNLVGRWTVAGAGGVLSTETLTPSKGEPVPDSEPEPEPDRPTAPSPGQTPRIRV